MKRTGGVTVLCIVLAWLAIAGIMNGWAILSGDAVPLAQMLGLIGIAYGVAAAVASIGLWLMRGWSLVALRCWMGTCVLFAGLFGAVNREVMAGGVFGVFGFSVFIAVLFALLDRYVQRALGMDQFQRETSQAEE